MRFGNLIFGVALLLVATTLALTITFRNTSVERNATRDRPASIAPPARAPSKAALSSASPRATSVPRPPRREESPDPEELDLVIADRATAPELSPAQRQVLSERTGTVKAAALARLEKMTERFDLTREQRRKIFPLLVKSTNGYHPAMVVAAGAGGQLVPVQVADNEKSPEDAIHDALDPEQQEDFVEAQLDERAWWSEIVAQLEEDFDGAVAAGTAPPAEEGAVEEDPDKTDPDSAQEGTAPEQGGNIFDLIK